MTDVLLLTIEEAAERLKMSPSWVRKAIAAKELPAVRLGRCVRVRVSTLDAYMAARESHYIAEVER